MSTDLLLHGFGSLLLVATVGLFFGCGSGMPEPPATAKHPVMTVYHDVEVVDDYQWLENRSDRAVQEWTAAQNEYARHILDKLPARTPVINRLNELYREASPEYKKFEFVGGKLFALKKNPRRNQPTLVYIESLDDLGREKVIVDPNVIDTAGLTAIDFFVVSPDAALVGVSLSVGGTEEGDLHVFEVATGKELPDVVERVNGPTAGGDIAWFPDNSGFYYTRYPHAGERALKDLLFYQQVYSHRLGEQPSQDRYEVGRDFPDIAEITFVTSADSKRVIAQVANGDGGEFTHYLRDAHGEWKQITTYADMIPDVKFGPDNSLYALSHKGSSNGRVLVLKPGQTDFSRAFVLVPESEAAIEDFVVSKSKLYVRDIIGGPSQIRIFDHTGRTQGTIPLPPVSAATDLTVLDGDRLLYRNVSYTEFAACYTYQPSQPEPVRTAIVTEVPCDLNDYEVTRVMATSKDGTPVPLNIVHRKGMVRDGHQPTMLYGYGGYGNATRPGLDRQIVVWLEQGGIYAEANIRGGGEFGEAWHLAGNLTKKQNVFDDFAACAQYLIDSGYTGPSKLIIKGGSNGGLLVGAVMVQHPELFKAVLCDKGVLDALRSELEPNGAYNVTEFGTVENLDQFKALYAYSPYANVRNGVHYPDVLFSCDENDGRVSSFHSKKMAARMQAADPRALILLRVTAGRGHGIGSSLRDDIALYADQLAFAFDRVGLNYQQ